MATVKGYAAQNATSPSLLCVSGLFDLYPIARKKDVHAFLRLAGFYALSGAAALGTMLAIAPAFTKQAATVDFNTLYQSYHAATGVFLLHALDGFGLLLTGAVLMGLVLTIRAKNKTALRVIAWLALWLVLWCGGPAELGPHYLLQMMPVVAAVGLAGFFFVAKKTDKVWQKGAVVLCGVLLFANSAHALWFAEKGVVPNWTGPVGLFAAAHPPVVRTDVEEWLALAQYLRQTTGTNDHYLLVGSSFDFNQDILRAAFTDNLQDSITPRLALQMPEIDGTQPPPFDAMAAATIYVVPEPAQYHLAPEGQRVITAGAAQFPPPQSRQDLFRPDERVFQFQNGVKARIWRRVKTWRPAALIEQNRAIAAIASPQGLEPEWTASQMPLMMQTQMDRNGQAHIYAVINDERRGFSLFFNHPLPGGTHEVSGLLLVPPHCGSFSFAADAQDEAGNTLAQEVFAPQDENANGIYPVSLTFGVQKNKAPAFLFLHFTALPASTESACQMAVHNLGVM